jgi:hypothetical protein
MHAISNGDLRSRELQRMGSSANLAPDAGEEDERENAPLLAGPTAARTASLGHTQQTMSSNARIPELSTSGSLLLPTSMLASNLDSAGSLDTDNVSSSSSPGALVFGSSAHILSSPEQQRKDSSTPQPHQRGDHQDGWVERLMEWISGSPPAPEAPFSSPHSGIETPVRSHHSGESSDTSVSSSPSFGSSRLSVRHGHASHPLSAASNNHNSAHPAVSTGEMTAISLAPGLERISSGTIAGAAATDGEKSHSPSHNTDEEGAEYSTSTAFGFRAIISTLAWYVVLFFTMFLLVFAAEWHFDRRSRENRLALLELPPDARMQGLQSFSNHEGYDAFLLLAESQLASKKEINKLLGEVADRENKVAFLHEEINRKEELATNLKKVVERLKFLQTKHEEMERRIREEADAEAEEDAEAAADANVAKLTQKIDLTKYKEKLLRIIFGNQTLEEAREASILAKHKPDHLDDMLRLAQVQGRHEGGGKGVKVESVMRVSELEGILGGMGEKKSAEETLAEATDASSESQVASDTDDPSKPKLSAADKLVDIDRNEYVLSKPGDSSKKTVDTRLVMDLGIVICASAVGGMLASLAKQPILLGYLVGGSAIGPGGAKLIGQFIQIETLAQFGATFLLFALGVEFSVGKLRKVKHIALIGGGLQLILVSLVVAWVGYSYYGMPLRSSAFLGTVFSMSSTTVV